jgi:DNA modification methylase
MIVREEIIGDCRLIQGDALEVLPGLAAGSVDVLTDPPYGIGVNHNMGRRAGDLPSEYDPADWDIAPPDKRAFDEMMRCGKSQIIWGANHFIDLIGKRSPCWLVWDKLFSPEVSFASCELAWTSLGGVVKKFVCSSQRKNGVHPTQKPVALMEWCLGFMPDSETILDPFMGSGTTAVACIRTGRKFIGIEISPAYFDIACRRVREAYDQQALFAPLPERERERELFDAEN